MDFSLLSSPPDEPLPWIIAGFTIVAPAIGFLILLWFFRASRLLFLKSIVCPETERRATVRLITHVAEPGPYHDVRTCSLPENERELACRKSCLTAREVLEAPYIVARKL